MIPQMCDAIMIGVSFNNRLNGPNYGFVTFHDPTPTLKRVELAKIVEEQIEMYSQKD